MSENAQKICGGIQSVLTRARCMILVQRCEEAPAGRIEIISGDISIDAADSQSCVKAVAEKMTGGPAPLPQPQPQPQPQPRPQPQPQPRPRPLPSVSRAAAPVSTSYGEADPLPDGDEDESLYTQATQPLPASPQHPTSLAARPAGSSMPQTIQSLPDEDDAFSLQQPPVEGATTVRKPFAAQLIADGRVMKVKRKMLVGNGKGFDVSVEYSVTRADAPDRYRLSYTIAGDGIAPVPLRTIEFGAAGGRTELSFEISLTDGEDDMKVLSIAIVEGAAGSIG